LSSVSSTDTPTTCRPFLPYLFWNSTNHGISILQGPHHVAQKSSRITLPASEESFTSLLLTSFSVKFKFAGFALAGHAAPAGAADAWHNAPGSAVSVTMASARQLPGAVMR